jgi:hypothetical protein
MEPLAQKIPAPGNAWLAFKKAESDACFLIGQRIAAPRIVFDDRVEVTVKHAPQARTLSVGSVARE